MSLRIGINGFGRIGRLVFRAAVARKNVTVAAINDISMDLDYIIYLLKYDSIHGTFYSFISPGRFDGTIEKGSENELIVNGNRVKVFKEKDPANIPWGDAGAAYISESSGVFLTKEQGELHLKKGISFDPNY